MLVLLVLPVAWGVLFLVLSVLLQTLRDLALVVVVAVVVEAAVAVGAVVDGDIKTKNVIGL